jgi:Fe-S oxidoreductase
MARIKAEFMAGYQDRHGVPFRAWLFANVHRLYSLGGLFPRLSNAVLSLPVLPQLGAALIGVAPERRLPRFAPQRFTRWQRPQSPEPVEPAVSLKAPILLVDTFTEFNDPQIGRALAYLMARSGVQLAVRRLPWRGCCGRPALSKGLLDQAKALATANVQGLTAWLRYEPDARFMLIEPSCVSALRDDTVTLVDKAWQAAAADIAARTISVEEWLDEWREAGGMDALTWDHQPREIILHGHCHQKTLWGTGASLRVLRAIPGAAVRELDAGCCGMAGSFGYEKEHYAVSTKIAEQRLWPAVRNHPRAIIAASGTSCREQVAHIESRAQHPVEIVARACGWLG